MSDYLKIEIKVGSVRVQYEGDVLRGLRMVAAIFPELGLSVVPQEKRP